MNINRLICTETSSTHHRFSRARDIASGPIIRIITRGIIRISTRRAPSLILNYHYSIVAKQHRTAPYISIIIINTEHAVAATLLLPCYAHTHAANTTRHREYHRMARVMLLRYTYNGYHQNRCRRCHWRRARMRHARTIIISTSSMLLQD